MEMLHIFILILQCIHSVNISKIWQDKSIVFTVLGDWGSPDRNASSAEAGQVSAATSMNIKSKYRKSKFVISVGDNFYVGGNYTYDGVLSVNDTKWNTLWKDVYTDHLAGIPWYSVMGNHDWYGKPDAQISYSRLNPNSTWKMPNFFFIKVFPEASATFIFIDTNLLNYGYLGDEEGKRPAMKENFKRLGWTRANHTITKQLQWIQKALAAHSDKKYLFVVGHHPLATCPELEYYAMPRLKRLLKQYKVTAYFFGHQHTLQYVKEDETMFIQSGAGSKKESLCSYHVGWGADNTFGYALGQISHNAFEIRFYNDMDYMLASFTNKPRL